MLFGDAHIEIPLREALFEFDQAAALAHGGRDGHQARILLRRVAQPRAEHLREGALAGRLGLLDANGRIEFAGTVVEHGIGFRQLVALALARDDMQELQAFQGLEVLQRGNQRIEVVAVDGADVVEAQLFEQRGGRDHALGVFLEAARQFKHRRHMLQHRPTHILGCGVKTSGHQARQITVQRPHRRRDRHVVVVQDHQQVDVGRDARIVHGLERHARGHGAVADHGDVLALFARIARSHRHAQGRGDRRGRMRGAEGVVLGLTAFRKARNAALLAQLGHAGAASRQDLVRIGLMAHVPHDAVMRRVEHLVQRQREFDGAQVGRQVSARFGYRLQHEAAQFVGELFQFATIQALEVSRRLNAVQ